MEFEEEGRPVALQLTLAQRWQLVQEGYNPLSAESIERWQNKQPPDRQLAATAAKVKKENLGSRAQSDSKDYSFLKQDGDANLEQLDRPITNGRDHVKSLINDNYDYGGANSIEEKVRSRLSTDKSTNENYGPIKKPRIVEENRKKQMITESKEAVNVGYRNGIAYLNAFVAVLKDPSYTTRTSLIERINTLIVTEDSVVDDQLKYYRGGIAKAEKEMYIKLKGNNG